MKLLRVLKKQEAKKAKCMTDEITKAWSGMTTRKYKNLKGLTKENLRDNMSTTELILNMLAETSTTDISKEEHPQGLSENIKVAKRGGNATKIARQALETETGKSAITHKNVAEIKL